MLITRIVGFILIIPVIIFLYMTMEVSRQYSLYWAFSLMPLVVLYIFHPQLEWWWAQKHPPKINPLQVKFLNEHFDFFKNLNGAGKDKFLRRLTLFIMAREFIAQVGDSVPTPLQTMICAEGVRMTFGLEDYLVLSYERVVIYPHPFPTPDHKVLHHSETNHEDGVLIFASMPIVKQFRKEALIFNIALYEWVSALKHANKLVFPQFEEDDWHVFGQVYGCPKVLVTASIGLPDYDLDTVAAVLYLTDPPVFHKMYPEKGREFELIFNQ